MPKKIQRFSTEDTKEETHTQQKSLSYSEIVGNLTDDQTVSLHKQLQEFRDYLLKKSLESEKQEKEEFPSNRHHFGPPLSENNTGNLAEQQHSRSETIQRKRTLQNIINENELKMIQNQDSHAVSEQNNKVQVPPYKKQKVAPENELENHLEYSLDVERLLEIEEMLGIRNTSQSTTLSTKAQESLYETKEFVQDTNVPIESNSEFSCSTQQPLENGQTSTQSKKEQALVESVKCLLEQRHKLFFLRLAKKHEMSCQTVKNILIENNIDVTAENNKIKVESEEKARQLLTEVFHGRKNLSFENIKQMVRLNNNDITILAKNHLKVLLEQAHASHLNGSQKETSIDRILLTYSEWTMPMQYKLSRLDTELKEQIDKYGVININEISKKIPCSQIDVIKRTGQLNYQQYLPPIYMFHPQLNEKIQKPFYDAIIQDKSIPTDQTNQFFNPSTDQNMAYSKERIKLNLARKAEFETAEQKNKTIMDQRTQLKKQPIRNNQSPAMEER